MDSNEHKGEHRKGDNQKLKMLYLLKIFSEETDDRPFRRRKEPVK